MGSEPGKQDHKPIANSILGWPCLQILGADKKF